MSHRFSDAQLIVILQKSARRINRVMCLTGTTSALAINTTTGEITPDDPDLQDLVLMQAECMISQTEYQTDLADGGIGLLVKDGEQSMDTRGKGVARGTFFDSSNSPCSDLKAQLITEKLKRTCGYDIW